MQEMRISQLVLDPTSHADSKNLKFVRSTPPRRAKAHSLPYLHTEACFPIIITPVAHVTPSLTGLER